MRIFIKSFLYRLEKKEKEASYGYANQERHPLKIREHSIQYLV